LSRASDPGVHTLANAERGQPADRDRERRAQRDRNEREHRECRTAGTVLERACGGARRDRVRNAPRQEDDERRGEEPGECFHVTTRVNGAVSTRPSTLHCKKSRQVPGTGSKTPTRNWPGLVALPQQIQDLQSKITSAPTSDPNLPLLQQQLLTAQQRLLTVSAQLGRIPATEVAASEGFILDLLSDENGISFHRLQVFGWTLVFWAVFVSMLFKKVTMVDFDATQLALMGISGSTYLGFKLQEK